MCIVLLLCVSQGSTAIVSVNGNQLSKDGVNVGSGKGFIGFGTSGYFLAEFDNFKLNKGTLDYDVII